MVHQISAVMREVFTNVQYNRTSHKNYQTQLKRHYERTNINEFSEAFISCLMVPLTHGDKHPHVENTLEFAAKFACSLHTAPDNEDGADEDDDEHMCPFLLRLFNFLLDHHRAKHLAVRFRVCHFLNILMNSMGEHAFMVDELCDKITTNMMERLLDKAPKVRAQAVFALTRLQDPTDENCPVIRMYIFHLSKDPNSDVRKAVLNCMAKNKKSLQAVLKRTRDINENVRKMAYNFISKVTVKSLTIKQRDQLLNDGLNDRSEIVAKTVRDVLLPSWLLHFEGDYTKLLRALDAESATKTSISALNALFRRGELSKLIEQLPVDSGNLLIPIEKLTSETVLYWRCLVEHLHRESCTDQLEMCLPELSEFCNYIREYLGVLNSNEGAFQDKITKEFILYQLFEIAKTFDLADESGRASLMQLILDTLLSDNCSITVTECIVKYFEQVVPDVESRLTSLAHIISEIRMPTQDYLITPVTEAEADKNRFEKAELGVKLMELQDEEYDAIKQRDFLKAQELKETIEELQKKIDGMSNPVPAVVSDQGCSEKNDPETMIKCLTITCSMSGAKSVTTLTPTLRSLMDNLALPSLDHEVNAVNVLALKAVAIFCLLDQHLAKKYIFMYFLQFTLEQDNRDIWLISLKAIFDLLLEYGLEFFEIAQEQDDITEVSERRRSKSVRLYNNTQDDVTAMSLQSDSNSDGSIHFVKILTGLLDNGDQELRTIATEGLCKLILHGRIKGAYLLSRLVILFYNPISEDDVYLRQCLCTFFKTYVSRVPDSQEMIELAFLPTLKTLANAPDESPLQGIEPTHVAEFLLGLTSSRNHKPGRESYVVHNNLAVSILAEALDNASEIDRETLLKSLSYLDIKFDDNFMSKNLSDNADKIIESLDQSEKRLLKYVQQFKRKLDPAEASKQEILPNGDANLEEDREE